MLPNATEEKEIEKSKNDRSSASPKNASAFDTRQQFFSHKKSLQGQRMVDIDEFMYSGALSHNSQINLKPQASRPFLD